MDNDIFTRLQNGETVSFSDPEYHLISEACKKTKVLLNALNATTDDAEFTKLLSEICAKSVADSVRIFTPFHINYGKNTQFGKNIFINLNCVFLDLGGIQIDDGVMLAPGVKLLSEGHPVEPSRRKNLTAGKIHIKKNVWIGANATILQGVTVGENSVVAAGAVVSKDVPANVMVGGIPAKILKNI